MKRLFLVLTLLLSLHTPSWCDEGMWLIQDLSPIYGKMQSMGLNLPLATLYNPQNEALSDAIVAIDGGMGTGSMISDKGLLITNHHVAYSDIHALSTPEKNYLEDGFWAMKPEEEIPIKGKTVSFLRSVKDVTNEVNALIHQMQQDGHWGPMSMRRVYANIEKKYAKETSLEVSCVSMWKGLKYYLYFYEVFRDIRLVAAPPVSIGAFGGEYDNWSWPQHKGDFTLYRVYGNKEGLPADYSPENLPIKPHNWLSISTKGVKENQFTMILGYPGRTNRYTSSWGIEERQTIQNPIVIKSRHQRMDILRKRMNQDEATRLKYADKYFSLSNFADLAKWENKCLARFKVTDIRRAEEKKFKTWIEKDSIEEQKQLLSLLQNGYANRQEALRQLNYFRETWLGPSQTILTANRISSYIHKLQRQKIDTLKVGSTQMEHILGCGKALKINYDRSTERELLMTMTQSFVEHTPKDLLGEKFIEKVGGTTKEKVAKMILNAFDHSFCQDAEHFEKFFETMRTVDEICQDPLIQLTQSVQTQRFTGQVSKAEKKCCRGGINHLEKSYTHLLYQFRDEMGQVQYPDANSTMRLTFGRMKSLSPRDGVNWDAQTTSQGILQKFDATQYEFRLKPHYKELLEQAQWGRWAERGEMVVNFLSDNDITGGNSGSPILNGDGDLIGLAFDGNRESMACDLYFEPTYSRTVCVDIRYVMWIIEYYGKANWLLKEMNFL